MSTSDVLLEAHALIHGARQSTYGDAASDYAKVVAIFAALTGVTLTVEQALLFMVAVKFARLRTNIEAGGWHHDSLVDAVGYLGLLDQVHNRSDK